MKLPLCESDYSPSLCNDEIRMGGAIASTPHVSSFLTQGNFTVLSGLCDPQTVHTLCAIPWLHTKYISTVNLLLYNFCVIDINLGKDILISN
jgi:hypothetical protein